MIAAIRGEERRTGHPESALERNLRVGLTHAVERWFATASPSADTDLHFALGRAHARSGRGLDELMGFYRVAGRTAWLCASEVGATRASSRSTYIDWQPRASATSISFPPRLPPALQRSSRIVPVRNIRDEPNSASAAPNTATRPHGARRGRRGCGDATLDYARVLRRPRRALRRVRALEPRAFRAGAQRRQFRGRDARPRKPGAIVRLTAASERTGAQLALGPVVAVAHARAASSRPTRC